MLTDEEIIELFRTAVWKIEKRQIDELDSHTEFSTLGFDSVTTMEILSEIEEALEIEFPEYELPNLHRMTDLIGLVRRLI